MTQDAGQGGSWVASAAGSPRPVAGRGGSAGGSASGNRSRFKVRALTATSRLEPDIDRAAISGRRTRPNAGSNTPAAIGTAMFERLLNLRNDVGLLAQEYDPVAGWQLGNFPQALTHLALVSAALMLGGSGRYEPVARP